jgi:hypothetical protein
MDTASGSFALAVIAAAVLSCSPPDHKVMAAADAKAAL